MESLRKKRGVIRASLTRLEKVISEETEENVSPIDAKIKLDKLEEIVKAFEQVQLEIEMQLTEEEMSNESNGREDFETKYYFIKGWCLRKMARNAPVAESTILPNETSPAHRSGEYDEALRQLVGNQAAIATALSNLSEGGRSANTSMGHGDTRLPPISLQPFSGDYKEWPTFKDLFRTMVHESSSLSKAQKLQYLKLSLKEDAASVLKHINICDANYEQAWQDLCSMYDREKVIIEAHIKAIKEQAEIDSRPSAVDIRRLFNTTNESVSALKSLGMPVEHWDAWLIYVISSKLDQESRRLWARTSAAMERPVFKDVMNFLTNRQFELESMSINKGAMGSKHKTNRVSVCTAISYACSLCKGSHFITACPQYSNLGLNEKRNFIARKGLCYNCLNSGHTVKSCKSGTCRKCKARHHTSIHVQGNRETRVLPLLTKETAAEDHGRGEDSVEERPLTASVLSASNDGQKNDQKGFNLLPTAVVLVRNCWGEYKPCKVLLDSGSQVTLITESCMQYLGLPRGKCSIAIDSVGNTESRARGLVFLDIRSRLNNFSISSPAVVLSNITKQIPSRRIHYNLPPQLDEAELADPSFGEPRAIDILLKSSILFKVLSNGRICDSNSQVIAQNTKFGWVLTGEAEEGIGGTLSALHAADGLEELVQRFWDLEDPKPTLRYLNDDHPCETHFKTHYRRNEQGRFVVRLPFKESAVLIGDSRRMAEQRIRSMERRFERDPELHSQYKEFMDEYQRLGHMVKIDGKQGHEEGTSYYLPHHSVIKPDSTTTRLRVVFDATCKPPSGNSLNSQLLTGPVIQKDLMTILLQFILNPIALTADIAKMYRQILIHPDDRKYQQILWRASLKEQMTTFQLTTVTYGTSPASFLATRCLEQLAKDGQMEFPEAASMITDFFYMDDFLTSCSSEESARRIVNQLCTLLQGAGFNIRKWASNSKGLLDEIPLEKREPSWSWSTETNQPVKTLGLRWHPVTDTFTFKVTLNEVSCYTKRNLLSEACRIFDPLGFLAPFLINYRVLLQRLWCEKVDWDDQIPLKFIWRWEDLRKGLTELGTLEVSRYKAHNKKTLEMHGFCDASEEAYAAVVYLRSVGDTGNLITSFITAKAKVAPLKPLLVIARLELCAAVLLSKLVGKLRETKGYETIPVYGWTDSTVVLHWLNGHPRKFANFIGNRISAITSVIPAAQWRHVKGEVNPADCASRGIRADQLISHASWWNGPESILAEPAAFGVVPGYNGDRQKLEERRTVLSIATSTAEESDELLNRFSSLTRLVRVTAWMLRFLHNCRTNKNRHKTSYLKTEELEGAKYRLVKVVQISNFSEEMEAVREGHSLRTSQLIKLNPILDSRGLLRVGGRLEAAPIGYAQRHPLILPYTSPFTKLYIWDNHHKYLHAGPQLMLALLRRDYWIIGARNAVRNVKHRCVVCQRYSARPVQQLMGNLPRLRLQAEKAFENVGMDYAGPILATPWRKRGCRSQKVYVALFICLCTKAIHLELVSSLSTDAFLAALKRFIARRGRCTNVYSDNGTNFVGAKNYLDEVGRFLRSAQVKDSLCSQASKENIVWHFIPPSAPHFGGLWEAGVKSMKYHLRRTIGCNVLSFEELQTLLCQVEACLNSRPLVAISDSIEDFEPLTPAHFLVGESSYFLPDPEYLLTTNNNININRLSRFQLINRLQQAFWKRWQLEYVSTLQQRKKWKQTMMNLKTNDMVLIRDDHQPPGKWTLGRVKEVHSGADGLVRVVTLLTKSGLQKRPISKICLLDLN